MPLAAAVVGSAVIGGAVQMSAASKAAKASKNATNAQIAEERANAEAAAKRLDPFVQGGYVANNALASRLGLSLPAANTTPTPSASTPGVVTPANAPGGQINIPGVGGLIYNTPAPTPGTVTPQTQPANTNQPAPPPQNALTGGAALTGNPYTYGNPENPTFTDPGFTPPQPFHYTQADYTQSPAYQYTVDQAMKGALASSAATGALRSGSALKALQDRAAQLAYQDFGNERNFALGAYQDQRNYDTGNYQTNRAFNYQTYGDQRNYLTNRADAQTANLFDYAKMGANAAAGVNQSASNATNGIVNALGSNGTNQGNAAIAGANALTGVLSSGVNALAYQNALRPSLSSAVTQGVNANPLLF